MRPNPAKVSGVVDQVGADVDEFSVGDRVVGLVRGRGDAEYVVTTPDRLAAVPDALSLRRAATIPQGAETARRSLDLLEMKPRETVLVNAAAGSVGSAAVQMLVGMAATVIGDDMTPVRQGRVITDSSTPGPFHARTVAA